MAITVKHSKVSAIPDGDDDSVVRPSDWNDDHVLTGTVPIANGGTGASTATDGLNNLLPSQSGNSGKVLSTDGTNPSWIAAGGVGTVTSVAATAGTGIAVTGSPITTSGTLNITNTAPDQTVVLTAGTGISTSGTYPNFTITNTSPSLGGDVVGPASATDNAIARFDSTTGKLIQNSVVTVSDTGVIDGATTITNIDVVDFDTTYATTLTEGQLGWDGNNTLALGMAGGNVIQHIGEDSFFYIKASSAITKGQLVMFTGAVGASGVITGAPSTGVTSPQYIVGIAAESIALNGFGLVQWFGEVTGVNTSTFAEGDVLYYDSTVTGGLTNVYPTSGIIVTVAAVAKVSAGGGVLVVRVSPTQRITASTGISVSQNNTGATITNTAPDQTVVLNNGTGISVTGTYPNFTVTNTAPSSGGTVTSVTATSPVTSTGGTTPVIAMPAATTSVNGYLTSTDWTTFNSKVSSQWTTTGSNIYYNTGNVGIGTSSPATILDITKSTDTKVRIKTTGGATTAGIDIAGANATVDTNNVILYQGGNSEGYLWNRANTYFSFGTNNTERMRIDSAGNVGIGNASPSKLLDVNGDALISGLTVGKGGGSVSTNTAVGLSALLASASGGGNVAVGKEALTANTSGSVNTAVGSNALIGNTSGASNTALGSQALNSNTTASNNTAVGYQSLYTNTTGVANSAFGYQAAYSTTTASPVDAFGYQSLYANTTGAHNASFGAETLKANTTGNYNTGLGRFALYSNTTASNNTAVGYQAGYNNTTATVNTFIGGQAGYNKTTGDANTFVGYQAGFSATTSAINTFLGYNAGYNVTTGAKNTIIGAYSGNQGGLDIRTASNYIVLSDGDGTWRMYFNGSGAPYLGAVPSGTNATLQWNSGTGAVTYLISSAKYKTNIQDTKYGLADVLKMRAVTFNHISDNTPDVGVIAEEMVDIIPEVVGLKDGEPDYVGYERLSSIFIKAIQELNAKVEAQALEIATLKGK